MSSFDAGRIVATADVDRTPFQQGLRLLKQDAREFADRKITATADLDAKPADAKILDFKQRLDRLGAQRVTPTLSVDNAAGLVKLVDFQGRLDALRSKVATARADVDTDKAREKLDSLDIQLRRVGTITAKPKVSVEGVERANLQLDALELKLRVLGATTARPNVAAGGGGGLFNRLAGYGGGGGFFAPGGLAGAAVLAAPAAVPLGIAGAGLGASFLTPTVAGGAGLGLFGAATKSALTRVDKVQTQVEALDKRIAATPATTAAASPARIAAAQQRLVAAQARLAAAQNSSTFNPASVNSAAASVTAAQSSLAGLQGGGANPAHDKLVAQRAALLKTLTPAENAARESTERLEKSWVHFQRQLEPESFKALATGTTILRKGLNDLLPMTKAVGDDVDNLAKRASKALDDPFWQHFFGDFLTREAPKAVDALGTSVGNVVTGIAHLAEGWAPLGHSLEHDIVNITARFNAWTQGDGPGAFVALVRRDGPLAAQAIEGIAHGLVGIGKGLEPIGRVELQALTPVLNFIGDLGKQHPGVITALGAAYLGVAGGLKAIAAVKGIAGVTGLLRGGGGSSGKGGILGGILNSAGSLGTATNPMYVVVVNKGGSGLPGGAGKVEKDATTATEAGVAEGLLSKIRTGLTKGLAHGLGGVAIVAGTDLVGHAVGGGAGHVIRNLGTGAGLGYSVAGPPGAVAGAATVGAGYGVNAVAGSVANLLAPSGAESAVIRQLMANGQGEANLAKLHQIAANQMRDTGHIAREVALEISGLTRALNAQKGAATGAAGANSALTVALKKIGDGSYAAGENIGTNLGLGLIAGIEAQIPHATVAGKLLVASTAKHLRLDAGANANSIGSVVPPVTSAKHKATKQQVITAGTDLGQAYGGGVASGITASAPVISAAVTNLVGRIQARLQAAGALEQQLTSSLLGQTGFAGFSPQTNALGLPVAPTSAGILLGLRHQKSALSLLRQRLHREANRGLSTGAEQQIIGLGLGQGGAYAASLAHDSRAQLRSISRLLGDVHGEAAGISKDVTRDIYGPKITDLLQKLVDQGGSKAVVNEIERLRQTINALGLEVRGAQHKAASRTSR